MSIALPLLSIALKLTGVGFLFAAALGLLRFTDPLQRMHSTTKAGTIGAGLVLAGAVLLTDSAEGRVIGVLAIFFLFLTAPVASHLLGRAAYVSGAELIGIEGNDALQGVLPRHAQPLERRALRARPRPGAASAAAPTRAGPDLPALACVRFAIVAPHEAMVARRALGIAHGSGVAVEARAIIDAGPNRPEAAADALRDAMRARLADAVATVQALVGSATARFSLFYTEGRAETLIADAARAGTLLVLPPAGDCDHGVGAPAASCVALRLLAHHAGPVLICGERPLPAAFARVAIVDDGSAHIVAGLVWALKAGLWNTPACTLVQRPGEDRLAEVRRALVHAGLDVPLAAAEAGDAESLLPAALADFDAVVLTGLAQHLRDGQDEAWRRHVARAWTGEILVIPDDAPPRGTAP